MRLIFLLTTLTAIIAIVAGCGGGGGTGAATPQNADSTPTVTTFFLTTVGNPTTLYGLELKGELPAGVTLHTDTMGQLDTGVVIASGEGAGGVIVSDYRSTASTRTFTISLTKLAGFHIGEFARVTAQVATGTTFLPENVLLSGVKVYDNVDGVPQKAITAVVAFP